MDSTEPRAVVRRILVDNEQFDESQLEEQASQMDCSDREFIECIIRGVLTLFAATGNILGGGAHPRGRRSGVARTLEQNWGPLKAQVWDPATSTMRLTWLESLPRARLIEIFAKLFFDHSRYTAMVGSRRYVVLVR